MLLLGWALGANSVSSATGTELNPPRIHPRTKARLSKPSAKAPRGPADTYLGMYLMNVPEFTQGVKLAVLPLPNTPVPCDNDLCL